MKEPELEFLQRTKDEAWNILKRRENIKGEGNISSLDQAVSMHESFEHVLNSINDRISLLTQDEEN